MSKFDLFNFIDANNLWSDEIHYPRNTFIKSPDTVDNRIYYIKAGSVKIGYYSSVGEEIVRLGYQGEIVVDLESFLTNEQSNLFIQTIQKTTLKCILKSDFIALTKSSHQNLELYNTLLEQLVIDMLVREKDLLLLSPKDRFERFVRRSPLALKYIPQKYIAQYLRMSPETLSRLVKY